MTPILPEPIAPTSTSAASQEELSFFDRVKKYIGNKSTMNEFLKLCNLFSQDLIDRNVLVSKVSAFIGGNPDLMNWFKAFVGYEGQDEVIDNRPKPPTGRVSLSNCRGLGPSYRLLPRRVRTSPSLFLLIPLLSVAFSPATVDTSDLQIVAAIFISTQILSFIFVWRFSRSPHSDVRMRLEKF